MYSTDGTNLCLDLRLVSWLFLKMCIKIRSLSNSATRSKITSNHCSTITRLHVFHAGFTEHTYLMHLYTRAESEDIESSRIGNFLRIRERTVIVWKFENMSSRVLWSAWNFQNFENSNRTVSRIEITFTKHCDQHANTLVLYTLHMYYYIHEI